ncbi:MAG: prepilin-type N-terminal cleavage/methylation domain-containing protein [Gemmatimonadaceae bacterium]|nr:prepilin-type N-terminal cleavage/methylation domain-containing protein [Gemmatimonadaceae bacterium]
MPRRSGFTFVEILVAMAVFGVLSAIAVPKYRQMREKAYVGALKADLAELRIAQEGFWAENHSYTTDTTQLDWRSTSDVRVDISVSDPYAGFDATARHLSMAGIQCSMSVGRVTAAGTPSGDITCGSVSGPTPGPGMPVSP